MKIDFKIANGIHVRNGNIEIAIATKKPEAKTKIIKQFYVKTTAKQIQEGAK